MNNIYYNNSGNGFFNSLRNGLTENNLVSKIAFVLVILFVFIIVLQISIYILGYIFTHKNASPHLLDGMIDAKQMITISQAPTAKNSKTIYRSVNADSGLEFTWSVWLFINDLGVATGKYQHIFNKGNDTPDPNGTGLNYPNNAPGMYISPDTNELTIIFNTYEVINEEITIPDIPMNKWFNVILRCSNKTVDVYVNGTVTKSMELIGVPKQNYGDVYIAMNGGFNGYISDLWYYSYSLSTLEIQNLTRRGPNTKMSKAGNSSVASGKNPDYLSLRWYFAGAGDEFNPVSSVSVANTIQ